MSNDFDFDESDFEEAELEDRLPNFDHYDENETPPFDAFGFLPTGLDHHEAMRKVSAIDSSLRPLEKAGVDPKVVAGLDAYFKRTWSKHHG